MAPTHSSGPLDQFCFYAQRDVSTYASCGLQYCPQRADTPLQLSLPDLIPLAQACLDTPGCESFNTNGWTSGQGLYAMLGGLELDQTTWAAGEQGVYVRRPGAGDPLGNFCFQPHLDIPGNDIGNPVPAYPTYSHAQLVQACLDTLGCL
ncbi:hypothetical protein HYH02_010034 [Chlamydomonas schloesseri]|uniref:Uncharacterized protein n=1 Tax=Chlamydomonas schloesseri TaxID=2026947 RepID=A0A835W6H4_9CHLO|nr:hypothetical protein HYH02_010034 [Chlamydomonas schloesseri]|eukprot:KAG2441190.1 hypothetical protein HYH02_010034 [Chlamydomonas schloesseri]